MIKAFTSLLILLIFTGFIFYKETPQGKYRWEYKLLVDTAGQRVFQTNSREKALNELVHIPRPSSNERKQGRTEAEKLKVCVSAFIVMLGKEDDNDYHLVLRSPDGKDSLIAEIPDPRDEELSNFPELKMNFENARNLIDTAINSHSHHIHSVPPVKVNITGVLFFDKMAHGKGHAKNGIEIHPVLEITAQ